MCARVPVRRVGGAGSECRRRACLFATSGALLSGAPRSLGRHRACRFAERSDQSRAPAAPQSLRHLAADGPMCREGGRRRERGAAAPRSLGCNVLSVTAPCVLDGTTHSQTTQHRVRVAYADSWPGTALHSRRALHFARHLSIQNLLKSRHFPCGPAAAQYDLTVLMIFWCFTKFMRVKALPAGRRRQIPVTSLTREVCRNISHTACALSSVDNSISK